MQMKFSSSHFGCFESFIVLWFMRILQIAIARWVLVVCIASESGVVTIDGLPAPQTIGWALDGFPSGRGSTLAQLDWLALDGSNDGSRIGFFPNLVASQSTASFQHLPSEWPGPIEHLSGAVGESGSIRVDTHPALVVNGREVEQSIRVADRAMLQMVSRFALGQIFYTLDGSEPTTSSTAYSGSFLVDRSVTVRQLCVALNSTETTSVRPAQVEVVTGLPATNTLPRLGGATNITVNELESYFQPLLPRDDDDPVQWLTVALLSGPTGLIMTNGVLAWTPTEAQGPSTNSIVVTVTDGLATVTNQFTITVLEVGDAGPTNPPLVLVKKSLSTSDLSLWTVLTRGGTSPLVSRYGNGGLIDGAPGYDGWWSLTTRFFLPADAIDPQLTLSAMSVDDMGVLYLNGIEVASAGIGAPGSGVFKRSLDGGFASQQFKNPQGGVLPPQSIGAALIVGTTNVLEMVVNNNNLGITDNQILTSDYSSNAHLATELSYGQPTATNIPTGSFSVVEGSFTWAQAKADAEARGGYLATFTSPEEWARGSAAAGSRELWIGAYQGANRTEPAGDWQWVTGEPWSFTVWG